MCDDRLCNKIVYALLSHSLNLCRNITQRVKGPPFSDGPQRKVEGVSESVQ